MILAATGVPKGIVTDIGKTSSVLAEIGKLVAPEVSIPSDGTTLSLSWRPVSGATDAEVDRAAISFAPVAASDPGIDLGHVVGASSGQRLAVPVPGGPRPVRSLYLAGLEIDGGGGTTVAVGGDRSGDTVRLAVAVEMGGVVAPVSLAVPSIPGKPGSPPFTTPPLLSGASFSSERLHLPDVMADKIWLRVVVGNDPEDFSPLSFSVDYVSVRAAPHPVDLDLIDTEGAVFASHPGPLSALSEFDATNAVRRGLKDTVANGGTEVSLQAKPRLQGRTRTHGLIVSGEVSREFGARISHPCDGVATSIEIPGAPLDARAALSVDADVTFVHAGMRLHPASADLPGVRGGLGGRVVSPEGGPILSVLPPAALVGSRVRRIGVIGYGLAAASLGLQLFNAAGGMATVIAGEEAEAELDAPGAPGAHAPRVVWFDLPGKEPIQGGLAVDLAARQGRFFWIEGPDGQPSLRVCIAHEPGPDDNVHIGETVLPLAGLQTQVKGQMLMPADFTAPPLVATDQIGTLVLDHLTLRYSL